MFHDLIKFCSITTWGLFVNPFITFSMSSFVIGAFKNCVFEINASVVESRNSFISSSLPIGLLYSCW